MGKRTSEPKDIIRKSFPAFFVETKQDESGTDLGVVGAFVAVMGNIDYGDDIIAQGAFKKTISERASKIRVLDNHNSWSAVDAVGKLLTIREVTQNELPQELLAQYPDATGGLYVEIQFILDEPSDESAKIFRRIKHGVIDEYSIGFEIIKQDYQEIETNEGLKQVRIIKEIRLWEVSPVIFAMNPATTTIGAKAKDNPSDISELFDDSELLNSEKLEAIKLSLLETLPQLELKDTFHIDYNPDDYEVVIDGNSFILRKKEINLHKDLDIEQHNKDLDHKANPDNYRMASDDSMCMNCRNFHAVTKNLGYCKQFDTTVTANYVSDGFTPKAIMLSENMSEMMTEFINSMVERYSFLGVWNEDDIKIIEEMFNSLIEAFLGFLPEQLIARELPDETYTVPKNDDSDLDTKAESDKPLTPDMLMASQRIAEIRERMMNNAKRKRRVSNGSTSKK